MADHSITFRIGSVFTGEGFKKAQSTVQTMNAEMKKGMTAAQQMSGCLGQLDSSSSKAASALTGMLQALMTMNVTVIASQAAVMALNLVTSGLIKKYDDLKTKAEEVKASVEKAFTSTLTDRMSSIKKETANLATEFERITKEANAFQAALNGVQQANQNGGIAHLQLEKLNAMLEAHSEAERANVEAAYNLKIAIQKSADTEATWQLKIEEAQTARVENTKRLAVIDEQIAKVSDERRQLEETMKAAKESNDNHWLEIQKQVNALKEQEQQLEQKRLSTMADSDVLELKVQQVKQEAANAQTQATTEIRNAELAEVRLREAKEARKVKEEAARDAADQKAAADLLDAKEVLSAADLQRKANEAAKQLESAQREYANRIEQYGKSDVTLDLARALIGSGKDTLKWPSLIPVEVKKSIQNQVVDAKVDDAIRNGTVNTVKDADRLQRQAMREFRNNVNKNSGQQMREAMKYKRLQDMNPKTLCSADKEFMAKYEKIQKAADERKKQVEESAKKIEEAKKIQKDTLDVMKDLSKQLKNLGLK